MNVIVDEPVAETAPQGFLQGRHLRITEAAVLFVVVLTVGAAFSLATPNFLTVNNLLVVGTNISVAGIVAGPATLLMICGQLDLSIGANVSLVGLVVALSAHHHGMPVSILIGFGVALAVGAGMGLGVTLLRVNPIIMSLGAFIAIPGAMLLLTQYEQPINGFRALGEFKVIGIPLPVLVFAACTVVTIFLLHATTYGRWLMAIGSNPTAARRAGIQINRVIFFSYLLSGAACGLAGLTLLSYIGEGNPLPNNDLVFLVLTAVILGGAGLQGGAGSIVGSALALILLGELDNGMILLNWNPSWAVVVRGLVLIGAVAFQQRRPGSWIRSVWRQRIEPAR